MRQQAKQTGPRRGTFYILKQSLGAILAAHAATLFSRPGRYLKTLRLALSHRAPGVRGLFLGIAHFAEGVLLARELRKRGTTHLHNHFANSAATVGLLASRMLGIRWSFTMHGISETDYPAGLMLGRKIEAADFVACVSWFGRAQGMRLVSADHWDKMHVVRCGLPLNRIPLKGPERPNKNDHLRRSSIAGKGSGGTSSVVCEHYARGIPSCGSGSSVTGLIAPRLKRSRRNSDVSEYVMFAGRLPEEDTLAEIARANLLVLPSFMEGLPIVLMEAMAAGVPVIASRVAGIPELVEDDETGLLFTPSNWDALTSRIDLLLGDEALRRRLAEKAKAKLLPSSIHGRRQSSSPNCSATTGEVRE